MGNVEIRLAFMAIVLLSSATGQAQDHLEPDSSIFRSGWSFDYYSNVARVLGDVLPTNSPKVFVLPSNMHEYVIGTNTEDTRCSVVVGRVQHILWMYDSREDDETIDEYMFDAGYPIDPLEVQVSIDTQPAPARVCERIRNAWVQLLLQTRYPDPETRRLGFDGVSYHFSAWLRGMGTLSGQTWSPDQQTVPGKFVMLAHAMRDFARSGSADDFELLESALAKLELELQ